MDSGIAIIIAALIAVMGYVVKGKIDVRMRERLQREERYKEMLTAIRGFYSYYQNSEQKQKFVDEFNQAYLYASDDVIRATNRFFNTVRTKPEPSGEEEKKSALANLVLAMRKDLRKTELGIADFETWAAT